LVAPGRAISPRRTAQRIHPLGAGHRRNANFAPHENTSVEVRFVQSSRGTLVSVTHRGWSSLRPDHPARHGREGAEFYRMIGLWWGEQMSSLREHAPARAPARDSAL
jgi:hypothetical protein